MNNFKPGDYVLRKKSSCVIYKLLKREDPPYHFRWKARLVTNRSGVVNKKGNLLLVYEEDLKPLTTTSIQKLVDNWQHVINLINNNNLP